MTTAVSAKSIAATLAGVHDCWMQRVGAALTPATSLGSRFGERWDVAHYLADRFRPEFELECALVATLKERLAPSAHARLETLQASLQQTSSELMDGRRHGWQPARMALLSGRLMEQARYWCAELELATAAISWADLSVEGVELLERLER